MKKHKKKLLYAVTFVLLILILYFILKIVSVDNGHWNRVYGKEIDSSKYKVYEDNLKSSVQFNTYFDNKLFSIPVPNDTTLYQVSRNQLFYGNSILSVQCEDISGRETIPFAKDIYNLYKGVSSSIEVNELRKGNYVFVHEKNIVKGDNSNYEERLFVYNFLKNEDSYDYSSVVYTLVNRSFSSDMITKIVHGVELVNGAMDSCVKKEDSYTCTFDYIFDKQISYTIDSKYSFDSSKRINSIPYHFTDSDKLDVLIDLKYESIDGLEDSLMNLRKEEENLSKKNVMIDGKNFIKISYEIEGFKYGEYLYSLDGDAILYLKIVSKDSELDSILQEFTHFDVKS